MKIFKNILLILAGFVGGIMLMLKWIARFEFLLKDIKKDFINKVEYILLGYNTIKTPPYTHRSRPYSYYGGPLYGRTTYRNYWPNGSFEEDENED